MLNYIGVFLTFRCGMGCDYCINRHGHLAPRKEITVSEWLKVLQNIKTREDLPITLQGGEPTKYPYFYELVKKLHKKGHKIDLLTNGCFNMAEFLDRTKPEMFKRTAPYASIRFSFHKNTRESALLTKVWSLQDLGYSVGIWGLDHPDMRERNEKMIEDCRKYKIDFRIKEFLDNKHGTYKYPDAITGLKRIEVKCTASELLFAPDGALHPCHYFLYSNGPAVRSNGEPGSVLCRAYGLCNPCDIKLKTNRLQESGHCSVTIDKV